MTWTEPATWYANLASFYAAAAAFITNPAGNVLLVKPTYRDHWAFPGGYVDEGGAVSLTVFPAILVSRFQRLGSGR
ncbi:hypothetical protein FHG89_00960 [Micromonospora orduensis]|uniref:Uncharacterized protein n=1 Tax=Micromonospora orduensis TaxID=1420891 RepID=A0A5C4R050_9ACTN|nr:NUDIX domain-containing protein [Micromonospora orduensis]TNH31692.1 hypothetical protein FHG89_00960 [Micromonospora orduensis]